MWVTHQVFLKTGQIVSFISYSLSWPWYKETLNPAQLLTVYCQTITDLFGPRPLGTQQGRPQGTYTSHNSLLCKAKQIFASSMQSWAMGLGFYTYIPMHLHLRCLYHKLIPTSWAGAGGNASRMQGAVLNILGAQCPHTSSGSVQSPSQLHRTGTPSSTKRWKIPDVVDT